MLFVITYISMKLMSLGEVTKGRNNYFCNVLIPLFKKNMTKSQ